MALDPREFIRVHSGMPEHPKVEPLSDNAFRALIEAWCLCRRSRNDGRLPVAVWEKRWKAKARKELIVADLVHIEGDSAVMHDWLEHQPGAAELEAKRAARAEAGRKGGQRSGETRRARSKPTSNGEANASRHASHKTVTSDENSPENVSPNRTRTANTNRAVFGESETSLPAGMPPGGEANASSLLEQTPKQNTNGIEPDLDLERDIGGHPPRGPYESNANASEKPPQNRPPLGPVVDTDGWKLVRAEIPDDHPHAVRTDLAIRAGSLLKSGTPEPDVRAALGLWLTKPTLGPGVLPSLVSEIVRNRARPPVPVAPQGSTADQRVAQAQAVKASIAARLAADPKALER